MPHRDDITAAVDPPVRKATPLPIVLLLDVSRSMEASGSLEVLNRAIAACFASIRANLRAKAHADIAVVAFAGSAEIVLPFTHPVPSMVPALTVRHGGKLEDGTDLGAAVRLGLDALQARRQWYVQESIPAGSRPVLVLMTDGLSRARVETPEFATRQRQAAMDCCAASRDRKLFPLVVGVGRHCSLPELKRYTADGGKLFTCEPGDFAKFLEELISLLVEVSQGVVDPGETRLAIDGFLAQDPFPAYEDGS